MVRGKFQMTSIREVSYNADTRIICFSAVYDKSIPEDRNFAKSTPSGNIEMAVNNPAAIAQFELGKFYYVDFTPVPVLTPAE